MKSGVFLVAFCARLKTYGALFGDKNHKAFSRFCLCGHEKSGLAVLAGRYALSAGILSSSWVDQERLFEGVFACVYQWMVTRWKHLDALAECLPALGSVHFGSPASGKNVFRHKTVVGNMPTIMIRREYVSYLFPNGNDADLFMKRLAQDGMLVRMEPGRHTVGKDPHYHLRLDWLPSYSVGWSDDEECFVALAA